MSLHVTTQEKLDAVERLIEECRSHPALPALKSIASDLRARLDGAPSVALVELGRRVAAAGRGDNRQQRLAAAGADLLARWPLVKQAIEKFGAELEQL